MWENVATEECRKQKSGRIIYGVFFFALRPAQKDCRLITREGGKQRPQGGERARTDGMKAVRALDAVEEFDVQVRARVVNFKPSRSSAFSI